jgi:GT2 family glycosyltransferase
LFEDCPADCTIIVLNRNGASKLESLLSSYLEHHDPQVARWIIVDHASTDDSREVVEGFMPKLPLEWLHCNRIRSFAESANHAVREARGRYLLFCNSGIVFDRPVLGGMLGALEPEDVGAVGVPLYAAEADGKESMRLLHAGMELSPGPEPGSVQAVLKTGQLPSETVSEQLAVSAALLACLRDDFLELGGFEEGYDGGFEDVDLCLRLSWDLGKKIVLTCETSALLKSGVTVRSTHALGQIARDQANRQLFLRRFGQEISER